MRRDPFTELQTAISNLEQFARRRKSSSLSDVILPIFSSKAKAKFESKKADVRNDVLQAIKTIKSHHFFIEKLKKGNDDDKKLADSIQLAIKQYHAVLDEQHDVPMQWSERLARFLSGSSLTQDLKPYRINLPNISNVQWLHLQNDKADARIQSAFLSNFKSASESILDPLLVHEGDALRMKASTLIRQHGITFKTISEALASVRNAPIRATYDPDSNTSTLYLHLNVLPGTVIKVQGSFKRNEKESSVPISDSFKLSLENSQNGFPFPAQYTGWAFHSALIPAFPLEIDQMLLFKPLYESKAAMAQTLLPNGKNVFQAKHLIELKKQAMNRHSVEFCEFHKTLALSFIENAPKIENYDKNQAQETVEKYFALIQGLPNALEYISEAYQLLNDYFVASPFAKLQEACHEKSNEDLFHTDVNVIQNAAFDFLDREFEHALEVLSLEHKTSQLELMQGTIEFVVCLARTLTPSFYAILLQNSSETLRCAPPMLDDFAQKIQLSMYSQLKSFEEELSLDIAQLDNAELFLENRMRALFQQDIALFQAPSFEATEHSLIPLVEELEDYFNTCYYAILEE